MASPVKTGCFEIVGADKTKDGFSLTINQKIYFKFSGDEHTLTSEEVERVRKLLIQNKVVGTIFLPQEEKIL